MAGLEAFDSYKNLQNLTYSELKIAVNYICAQMNSQLRLLVRYVLLYIKNFHGDGLQEKKRF